MLVFFTMYFEHVPGMASIAYNRYYIFFLLKMKYINIPISISIDAYS
jgi:hypothetical protein